MIVRYARPEHGIGTEAEVPCEADPTPFARNLIRQAAYDSEVRLSDEAVEAELVWCTADGTPLVATAS